MDINERFDRKIDKSGNCWIWTAAVGSHGYGVIAIRHGVYMLAHRFAYERANGPIPEGLFVCHTCDNRKCVQPEHLFVGSNADNMADARAKGRLKGISRPKWDSQHPQRMNPGLILRGEQHGNAKLTESAIREIRSADVSRRGSKAVLSRKYRVADQTITRIVRGESWAHVK